MSHQEKTSKKYIHLKVRHRRGGGEWERRQARGEEMRCWRGRESQLHTFSAVDKTYCGASGARLDRLKAVLSPALPRPAQSNKYLVPCPPPSYGVHLEMCQCSEEHPCEDESRCVNRASKIECSKQTCRLGGWHTHYCQDVTVTAHVTNDTSLSVSLLTCR